MRKSVAVTIVVFLAMVVLVSIVVPLKVGQSLFTVKAYFPEIRGLRPGTPVRMGGIIVGTVTGIRLRPELGANPVEVVMVIRAGYKRIPNTAVVALREVGLLRETTVEIDARNASGRPVQNGGVLQTRSSQSLR